MSGPRRILVVCTANRCRSPMAEALIRGRLTREGLAGRIFVASAGTWALEGEPATGPAVTVMAEAGLDINGHRSRPLDPAELARTDLILVMTRGHQEGIAADFPDCAGRVLRLGTLDGGTADIEDPVGRPIGEYRVCAREMARLIDAGWARIVGTGGVEIEGMGENCGDGSG